MNAVRAPRPEPEPEPEPYHLRQPQQIDPQISIGPWTGPASTILRRRAHNRQQCLLTTASQDVILSSQTVDEPADHPDPTPSPLPLPLPAPPTADDILAAAAATPIPLTREEVALESAQQTLKHSHAVFSRQAEAMRRWKADINQYAQDRVVELKVIKERMDAYGTAHSFWRQCSRLLYRQRKEEEKRKRAAMEAEQGAPSAADVQRAAKIKEAQEGLRRAQESRAAEEAELESAFAEEGRLKALLDDAQAVRVALEARVESAYEEETRLTELLERLSVGGNADTEESQPQENVELDFVDERQPLHRHYNQNLAEELDSEIAQAEREKVKAEETLVEELEPQAVSTEQMKEKAEDPELTEEPEFEAMLVEKVKEKAEQERPAEDPEHEAASVEQMKEGVEHSSLAKEPELEAMQAEQGGDKAEQGPADELEPMQQAKMKSEQEHAEELALEAEQAKVRAADEAELRARLEEEMRRAQDEQERLAAEEEEARIAAEAMAAQQAELRRALEEESLAMQAAEETRLLALQAEEQRIMEQEHRHQENLAELARAALEWERSRAEQQRLAEEQHLTEERAKQAAWEEAQRIQAAEHTQLAAQAAAENEGVEETTPITTEGDETQLKAMFVPEPAPETAPIFTFGGQGVNFQHDGPASQFYFVQPVSQPQQTTPQSIPMLLTPQTPSQSTMGHTAANSAVEEEASKQAIAAHGAEQKAAEAFAEPRDVMTKEEWEAYLEETEEGRKLAKSIQEWEDEWICEIEEEEAAKMTAQATEVDAAHTAKERPVAKVKGKGKTATKADVLLEFQRIEEARQQSEGAWQQNVATRSSEETVSRPLEFDEEAQWDDRADDALIEARLATAMRTAAEAAQQAVEERMVEMARETEAGAEKARLAEEAERKAAD